MFELNNRQIATLILLGIGIASLLAIPKMRRVVLPTLSDVLKTMAAWKIIVPFITYLLYAVAVVWAAYQLKFWHTELLVDTLIIILFVGLPMFMNAYNAKSGDMLIKKTLRETLGFTALVVFYIGLVSFSLIAELALQPIITLLILISVTAKLNPEHKPAKQLADSLLTVIGLWLIVHTTTVMASTWSNKDAYRSIEELLLSILLPLALLPVIYIFAIIISHESLFNVLPYFHDHKRMPRFMFIAIFMQLNFRLRLLNDFSGMWRQKLGETTNFREAFALLGKYKSAVKVRNHKLKNYHQHLQDMKDAKGIDANGLQLDRREFYESKSDLRSLQLMQMGQFRNVFKHYNPNLPIDALLTNLPKENHDIRLKVRKDKMTWYAWRQMPNGYYFGAGGTNRVDDIWLYDGDVKPNGYPSLRLKGWLHTTSTPKSIDWAYDDAPPDLASPEE